MDNVKAVFSGIFTGAAIVVVVMILAGAFVYLPLSLHADMKCKEAGYAKGEVVVDLTEYCVSFQGAVQTPAVPLKSIPQQK